MRILHINNYFLFTPLHQNMIEYLDKIGLDNMVFAPVSDKKLSVIKPNNNVIVSECFKKWDRVSFYYKQSKIICALENSFNVEEFDCIHAYSLFSSGNCAYQLHKKYGIPYVVAVRDTDVNTFLRYRFYLKGLGINILKEAEIVFFLSSTYRNDVINLFVPEELRAVIRNKSRVIPNGIDNFWIDNIAQPKIIDLSTKRIKLLFAGQLSKRKNVTTTIEALNILRDQGWDVSLTVVGKVVNKDIYEAVCKAKHVTYIPPQSKENLISIYREHDVFVMPSLTETFGLVYPEAMSQGLPVIYTRGQGFDGQFPEGTVGYSTKSKDPEEIAKRINECMENYSIISKACIDNIYKFKWGAIVEDYKAAYESIICKRKDVD